MQVRLIQIRKRNIPPHDTNWLHPHHKISFINSPSMGPMFVKRFLPTNI